jgi:hypothetical protein
LCKIYKISIFHGIVIQNLAKRRLIKACSQAEIA